MKTSTTNTAAREMLAVLLARVFCDAYKSGHHDTVEGGYTDVFYVDRDTYWREKIDEEYADDIATLTQQQGGEQEARCTDPTNCRRCSEDATTPHAGIPRGEQEARELLGEPWHEEISGMVRGNPLFDGQQQWVRLEDATAALRSKPAASEGDGRVDLQQFRPAVVNWRSEQRGTIKQLEDSVSQLGSGIQKLAEDRLREADRLLAIIDNTSKQADVAWAQNVAWAQSVLARGNWREVYIGHRCMRLEVSYKYGAWDCLMLAVDSIATPPRHPADEWRTYVDSFVGAAALNKLRQQFNAGARIWTANGNDHS